MLVNRLLTRPCTVISRSASAGTDDYGNPIVAQTTTDVMCELQQQQRTEPGDQGELSDTVWLLVVPAGTEIVSGDAATVDGTVYEMVGDPWHVRHPVTGQETHVECTVRRTA